MKIIRDVHFRQKCEMEKVMCSIIQFPVDRVSKIKNLDSNQSDKNTAEILFFSGVRYSKMELTEASDTTNLKVGGLTAFEQI